MNFSRVVLISLRPDVAASIHFLASIRCCMMSVSHKTRYSSAEGGRGLQMLADVLVVEDESFKFRPSVCRVAHQFPCGVYLKKKEKVSERFGLDLCGRTSVMRQVSHHLDETVTRASTCYHYWTFRWKCRKQDSLQIFPRRTFSLQGFKKPSKPLGSWQTGPGNVPATTISSSLNRCLLSLLHLSSSHSSGTRCLRVLSK